MTIPINEQTKVYAVNGLKRAHTEIHAALHELQHSSETEAKRFALSALKKIAEVLAAI